MTDVTVRGRQMRHDGQTTPRGGKDPIAELAWIRSPGVTVLIICGIRVFFHIIGQGVFYCQRCGAERRYRRRSGRKFFTLFFVPVIPLNKVGQHVQCTTCRTRFHPGVLTLSPAAEQGASAV